MIDPDKERLELGRNIRALRIQAGATLQDIATNVGVTVSLVSQIERGLANPSITNLRRIASSLGVPIATLFMVGGEDGNLQGNGVARGLVVRAHHRKALHVPESSVVYELLTPDLSRKIEFLWIEYEAGSRDYEESLSHPGEENALCLKGKVVVIVEGEEIFLDAGDSISFDSGRPHRVENRSSKRAVVISAITPPSF